MRRFCLQCLSQGVHVVIVHLLILAALILFLWKQLPSEASAKETLHAYLNSATVRLTGKEAGVVASSMSLSSDASGFRDSSSASSDISPLRLLIFHSQQLSLLLLTSASLPSAMNGLLSF